MTDVERSYPMATLYLRWGLLAAALFLVGTNAFVIAGVLPQIARELHVTSTEAGYSITVYALVVALVAPAISILVPRWSRTRLMVGGLAVVAAGTLVAAAAPDLTVFTLGRVIAAVGGAALVPTATAAGAALAPPERRGRAIGIVTIGFTLATAIGAPLGTAIAAATDWRVPMLGVAAIGIHKLPALGLLVRDVPLGAPVSLGARFGILRDRRILLPLVANLGAVAGFNIVYLFSASTTGFGGSDLAVLLLVYGVFGVIGNAIAGPLTDRVGSARAGVLFFVVEIGVLIAIAPLRGAFAPLAGDFVLWGLAAFAVAVPIQHRLTAVDPRTAGIAISWYSTALYLGVALAPVLAGALLAGGAPAVIPLVGAGLTAVGLVAFLVGYASRRRPDGADAGQAPIVRA